MPNKKIKFIDLFAGIGGFHQALISLENFECVFASEIDTNAAQVYELNNKIKPWGDIRTIEAKDIPQHDLICAGFPCQPFSKSGSQNGFSDIRGTLFYEITRIAKYHKPAYILIENVPNIISHNKGDTYNTIIYHLRKLGYVVNKEPLVLSPHELKIPVHRPRAFIIAVLKKSKINPNIKPPNIDKNYYRDYNLLNYFILRENKTQILQLSEYELKVLNMWDEFLNIIDQKILGFPIWFDYFFNQNADEFKDPKWKKEFIRKNKELYHRNKYQIDIWVSKYNNLKDIVKTHRKFEWQCGMDCNSVFDGLIQFRTSGIRVKRPNYFSTLVAMNQPQIVGPLRRRLSADETKLLQSFPEGFIAHHNHNIALKQFGNAVNVEVIKYIVKELKLSS